MVQSAPQAVAADYPVIAANPSMLSRPTRLYNDGQPNSGRESMATRRFCYPRISPVSSQAIQVLLAPHYAPLASCLNAGWPASIDDFVTVTKETSWRRLGKVVWRERRTE